MRLHGFSAFQQRARNGHGPIVPPQELATRSPAWQHVIRALCALVASLFLFSLAGYGQEVVSAQSGVIHFTEGAVLVDNVPLDRKPATFPLLKDGSVLKTEKGRAELMLTPGTFLRLDENSSVKMLSSALTATSVEFMSGSAILDATAAEGDIPVDVQFRDACIRFLKPGLYRIDSDTAVLQAYTGEAVVKQQGKETQVDTTRLYFFELGTDTKKFSDGTDDEFLDWARDRNQAIEEQNQAAQADDDGDADADLGGTSPFSFNVPYGNLGVTPGLPSLGNIYPYDNLFYSSYGMSPFTMLPVLPGPVFIISRPWRYRPLSPRWPHSSSWTSRYGSSTAAVWLASHPVGVYPHVTPTHTRPLSMVPHTTYSHPVALPHVTAPAVHVGHR